MTDQIFNYMLLAELMNKMCSSVIYLKVQVFISKQILIDLFGGRCCIFTHIQATLLAQSLMRWKNPKGQIMFKWHFDDISLACLTFGEFQFSCVLHLIHAEPFLIPSTTKHYFYDSSPSPSRTPWITAPGLTYAIQRKSREKTRMWMHLNSWFEQFGDRNKKHKSGLFSTW